jgi:hypothetical protein
MNETRDRPDSQFDLHFGAILHSLGNTIGRFVSVARQRVDRDSRSLELAVGAATDALKLVRTLYDLRLMEKGLLIYPRRSNLSSAQIHEIVNAALNLSRRFEDVKIQITDGLLLHADERLVVLALVNVFNVAMSRAHLLCRSQSGKVAIDINVAEHSQQLEMLDLCIASAVMNAHGGQLLTSDRQGRVEISLVFPSPIGDENPAD